MRKRKKPLAVLAGIALIAIAIAATVGNAGSASSVFDNFSETLGIGGSSSAQSTVTGLPPATAEVTKMTLTQTQSVGGILSYGEPVPLITHLTSGTITWMPAPGDVVKLGQPAFSVNNVPVVLIHGTVPLYRDLWEGLTGPDVQELEQSLYDLGYTDVTVDGTYDYATTSAVWAWQQSLGLEPTGWVAINQVVVADGDIRVALQALTAGSQLGGDANQTVLTYSGTTQVVSVPLDVNLQHLIAEGDTATVTLPNGKKIDGTVESISKVASTIEDKQILPMIVSVKDQNALSGFDAAPVTLDIVSGEHKNVLAVPITALVALQGGGYGVQVVQDSAVSYLEVETGMFADGMVEISGDGISEGLTVGVAQ